MVTEKVFETTKYDASRAAFPATNATNHDLDAAIVRDTLEGLAVREIVESTERWHTERNKVLTHPTVQGLVEQGLLYTGEITGETKVNGVEMKAGEPIDARAFAGMGRGEPVMVTPLKPITRADRVQKSLQSNGYSF